MPPTGEVSVDMGLMDKWRSKLRETNDALAEAHKSWRDEKLGEREQRASEREQSLSQREAEVTLKLAEMRAIEGRRLRRRLGTALLATATGVVGFLLGISISEAPTHPSEPTVVAPPAAPSEAKIEDGTKQAITTAPPAPVLVGSPVTSSRPHYPNPDQAAGEGLYGTGGKFNIGWYCLDKEEVGEITFEDCLGAAALWAKSQRKPPWES